MAHSESYKNARVVDKERGEATEDERYQIAPRAYRPSKELCSFFFLRAESLKAWKSRSGTI